MTAKIELNTNENTPLSNYNFKYAVNLDGQKLLEAKSVTGSDGVTFARGIRGADQRISTNKVGVELPLASRRIPPGTGPPRANAHGPDLAGLNWQQFYGAHHR